MAKILRESDQAELCYLMFLQFLDPMEGQRMRFMGCARGINNPQNLWALVEKVEITVVDDYELRYVGRITAVNGSDLGGVIVVGEVAPLESKTERTDESHFPVGSQRGEG